MIGFRQKLKKGMPYAMLTERADRRFDQVLRSLPERPAEREASGAHMPRHYAHDQVPEKKGRFAPGESSPHRERDAVFPFGRVLRRAAFSMALALVIGLTFLNMAAPRTAESLPGLGQVFRVLNSSREIREENVVPNAGEGEDANAFSLAAADAQVCGHYLFLTLTLTPQGDAFSEWSTLTTGWGGEEALSALVNGRRTDLYTSVNLRREGERFSGAAVLHLSQTYPGGGLLLLTVSLEKLWGLEEGESAVVTGEPLAWQGGLTRLVSVTPQAMLSPEELEGDGMFNGIAPIGEEEDPSWDQVSFRFSYPAGLDFTPMVSASRNGEYLPLAAYTEGDPLDDRVTVLYSFEAEPNEEPILLTVYSGFPGSDQFLGPEGILCSQKLGAFLFDPASDQGFTVLSSFSAGDIVPLEELCALQRAALSGQNHFRLVMGPEFYYHSGEDRFFVETGFCSDLDADLPLELEIAVPGCEAVTLPLYRLTEPRQDAWPQLLSEDTELGYNTVGDTVLVEMNSAAAFVEQYPEEIPPRGYARAYRVSAQLEGIFYEDGDAPTPVLTLLWNGRRIPLGKTPSFKEFDAWEKASFPFTTEGGLDQVENSPLPRESPGAFDPEERDHSVESEVIWDADEADG